MLVPTPDGRQLEVLVTGPDDGFPLVFLHGTPSGIVADDAFTEAAAAKGLRLIGYSRPGYGDSTPRAAGATVADDATDVATILDHLGYDRFVAVGWSGGGPRSLACAALLPDRCLAAVCGVGLVPPEEYDGDVREGMGEENVAELTAAMEGPDALMSWLEAEAGWAFTVTGAQIAESLGSLAPPVDRAALTGERAETAAAGFRRAGTQGFVGWRDDDLALVRPWGFSVRDVAVPVAVWQGTEDMMVPSAHAEWLIANVPGAQGHIDGIQSEG